MRNNLLQLLLSPVIFLAIIHIMQSFGPSVPVSYTCAAAIFNSLTAIAWDRHRNALRSFHSFSQKTEDIPTFGCLDLVFHFHKFSPIFFFQCQEPLWCNLLQKKKTMALKVVEIIATARQLETGKISLRKPFTLWWRFSFPFCKMEQFTRQLPWPSEIKSVDNRCCRIFFCSAERQSQYCNYWRCIEYLTIDQLKMHS